MSNRTLDQMKGTLTLPLGLVAVLVPVSLLLGWNLLTALTFWFGLVPLLSFYLPLKISSNRDHLLKSLVGMLLFYGLMVFTIYDHYQTDLFHLMIASCGVNVLVVSGLVVARRYRSATPNIPPTALPEA